MTHSGEVWVLCETRAEGLAPVSLELTREARRLADKLQVSVAAVLLGSQIAPLAGELAVNGADTVYLGENDQLQPLLAGPYASATADLVRQHNPGILLVGATRFGEDVAPRLAARLGAGLSADCIALDVDERGVLHQTVPAFGGKVMADVVSPERRPQMATVRPGVLRAPQPLPGRGQVVPFDVRLPEDARRVRVVEVSAGEEPESLLEKAEVVVAGGWGVGAQGWALVEGLARALGGAVGATRPAIDEGWAAESQMIGQSGKTVRPRLYIAVGISGAAQHTVGIRDSGIVVAVNSDPKAAIFDEADLGIAADFREVVPALISELQRRG